MRGRTGRVRRSTRRKIAGDLVRSLIAVDHDHLGPALDRLADAFRTSFVGGQALGPEMNLRRLTPEVVVPQIATPGLTSGCA